MTSANRPFDCNADAATVSKSSPESLPPEGGHWKILIVDDEEDIHSVTRLALRGFTIEDRKLIILNAYSALEAQTLIVENPDIAVILLDVVMETTHAGLDLVGFIRTDRKNNFVRIILRTGQPGEAPELAVMEQLKIDDYRLKTELTHDKLQAVLMASIRTYDAMVQVEKYRQNLEDKVKERTSEIEAQKTELESLNELKNKLLSILAHDLRSPLATLQSLLDISERDLLTPDQFQKLIRNIQQKLGYTTAMLEQLLNWANSQLTGFQMNPEDFGFKAWLEESLPMFHMQTRAKNISLKSNVPKEYLVHADKNMLGIVVKNLIENAIKFTPQNGSIQLNITVKADMLQVEVIDTGIGMSEEIQFALKHFNFRSRRGTEGEVGTGLGLMICRDFVAKNKGRFWFESEEHKGSSFTFSIPLVL